MTGAVIPLFPGLADPCSNGLGRVRGVRGVAGSVRDEAEERRSALMRAAQAGDQRAYAALLRDCVPLIRAAARGQGVAVDRLDDVVQDVLLTIHRVRHTYDPARPFGAWLRAIAQRRAIDVLRRSARQGAREVHAPIAYEGHPDPGAAPDRGVEQDAAARQVARALEGLSPVQREAVERLALREQSLAEAAAETGRSVVSLKVNLHRALKALRGRLGPEG